ncbi:MAG: dihydrodipicolinate synthase family protein [Eubacteriales bacterium]|nr:dihydrodipicolinate synthase family protein [Eubacteriales bacterium]
MENHFPGGVWPVMLTPFTAQNQIDYPALDALTDYYLAHGAQGLFAVCQSSEMFFLSLEERLGIARAVVRRAAGRAPVIASGHISDSPEEQANELCAMADTGIDALILITNRLAAPQESDDVWLGRLEQLLSRLPAQVKLGLYECPYPYKRLLTPRTAAWCAQTGRFYFLKDTCCDIAQIRLRLDAIRGTNLRLYNANTATLLPSLRLGAAGYSGVMAALQGDLYAAVCAAPESPDAPALCDALSVCALVERQYYPVNAKYALSLAGVPMTTRSRTQDDAGLTDTFREEVGMLRRVTQRLEQQYLI